jgi:hypothetical protein
VSAFRLIPDPIGTSSPSHATVCATALVRPDAAMAESDPSAPIAAPPPPAASSTVPHAEPGIFCRKIGLKLGPDVRHEDANREQDQEQQNL